MWTCRALRGASAIPCTPRTAPHSPVRGRARTSLPVAKPRRYCSSRLPGDANAAPPPDASSTPPASFGDDPTSMERGWSDRSDEFLDHTTMEPLREGVDRRFGAPDRRSRGRPRRSKGRLVPGASSRSGAPKSHRSDKSLRSKADVATSAPRELTRTGRILRRLGDARGHSSPQ